MQNTQYIEEDEIDLKELFATIWKNRFIIIIITFIITSLSILYTLSIPNSYKSSVVLAPQGQTKGVNFGGLSALAGITGVDLGGSGMGTFSTMQTVLNDNYFHKVVINKYNLMQKLASKEIDKNLVFAFNFRLIYDFFQSNEKKGNSNKSNDEIIFDTIKQLKNIVTISNDKKNGAITMSVEFQDRFLAKELLDIYLKETTAYIKTIDMKDINKKIQYYKNELSNINDIELKIQISNLISSLIQKKVLSSANEFYNVKIITKSQVAFIKDKTKPKRALIVIVSFVTSIILGIFLIFFVEFLKKEKD